MGTFQHIELLNREFEKRKQRNPRFSLRSYARLLGVSPSWLSEVLSLKKGISPSMAASLCEALQLTNAEKRLFELSVQASHSRSPATREKAKTQIDSSKADTWSSKRFAAEEVHFISDWYHNAILEILEIENCEHTTEWIAARLNLQESIVVRAISRLESIGLLEKRDGKWCVVTAEYETSNDVPSEAIKSHHRQILGKATDALTQQTVLQREFVSMTLSFDRDKLEEAKKEIRKFQRKFADQFYSQTEPKNSVYQFSMQFFRLDQDKDAT